MARRPKVYAYYRYNNFKATGTIKEVSKQIGVSVSYLSNLANRSNANELQRHSSREFMEYLYTQEPEYAFYDGEDIVADGTLEEIAEQTGLKIDTVYWYSSPSAQKRGNRVLVKIEEDYA